MKRRLGFFGGSMVVTAAVLAVARSGDAYQRYNDGCQNCHGAFSTSPYVPPSGKATWPSSLHTVHRDAAYMSTACNLCHLTGDNRNPYTNQSDGTTSTTGRGCVGCHGNLYSGTASGRGLRAHHVGAGVTICNNCHAAATPVAESVMPPYYGSPDTKANYSCNNDANTSEDWSGDGIGLDNDGDGKYDMNDSDCAAATGGTGGTSTGGTGGTGGTATGGTSAGGTATGGASTGGTATGGTSTGGTATGGTTAGGTTGSGGATSGGAGNAAGVGGAPGAAGGGAAGSAGTSSSGAGAGGRANTGGSSSAGAPATGGSTSGPGGAPTDSSGAGSGNTTSGSKDQGGCSCRAAGERSSRSGSLSALLLLLAACWRRTPTRRR